MSHVVLPEDILAFLDRDIQEQRILQAVYDDRGRYEHDVNLQPMLSLMNQRLAEGQPFWELRCIIRWAARRLQPQTYVEIGNRTGWSLFQAVRECPELNITGFDMWMDNYAEVANSSPEHLKALLEQSGHTGEVQFVSGNSHVTLPAFISGMHARSASVQEPFDLVTVDGDHSVEGARADLELCAPLVKPGGLLIFDDLIHEQHSYLLDLWHEFADAHPEFLCIANTRDYPGTGIGFRLPLAPFIADPMLPKPSSVESVSVYRSQPFTLLNQHVGYIESRLESVVGELGPLRAERHSQAAKIEQLGHELALSQADRDAKQAVTETLSNTLELVRDDQSAKQQVIDRLQEMIAQQIQQLEAQAALNAEQAVQLAAKNALVQHFSDELAQYRTLGWGVAHVALRGKRKLRRVLSKSRPQAQAISANGMPMVARPHDPQFVHIAIDVLQIQFGVSGGVEVYMQTLVRALLSRADRVRITLLCTPDQIPQLQTFFGDSVEYHAFSGEPAAKLVRNLQEIIHGKPSTPAANGSNISFARLEQQLGVDILHSPVQLFSSMDFMTPSVLNLHDLQHLHFPENFTAGDLEARNILYGRSAALASAIIASSEFVRRDIIERMNIPASKVHLIPAAFNPDVERGLQTFSPEQARAEYHLPEVFGFYPAQFWKHKNHVRLIEALGLVRARAPEHDFKLVFSGYRGHSGWPVVEEAIQRFGLHDHIMLLDFIPTEHLAAIYRCATFCVMPSLFEASSYPVIEAQTLACPAMCSSVPSLVELMADSAGLLFDPLDVEDIAEKMLRWLNDPTDRQAHAERGQQRALQQHSLAMYAERVLSLYTSLKQR